MITYGIVKPLELATAKNWADEELKADLEVLNQRLEKNIALLSSFDVYKQEVMSGNLQWTPVHRSEKFWRENVHHFEEDNHKILA
jgi:V-type H+-transporting ATPase subunit H